MINSNPAIRMKYVATGFLLLLISTARAQNVDLPKEYFNSVWEQVNNAQSATYYRTLEKKGDKFVQRDYLMSGKLSELSERREVDGEMVKDGKTIAYYEDGITKWTGEFENDRPVGIHTHYYSNGKPRLVRRYEGILITYIHFWSATGEELLPNGTGMVSDEPEGDIVSYYRIIDSVSVLGFEVNAVSGDTVYFNGGVKPEFVGGLEGMSNAIGRTLRYPSTARKKGIHGTTFLTFIVEKDGQMTDARVLKGFDASCDAEALRTLNAIADWVPGTVDDKPVRYRFVLPTRFKLSQ